MTTLVQSERSEALDTLLTVQVERLAVPVLVGEANVLENVVARTTKVMRDCMSVWNMMCRFYNGLDEGAESNFSFTDALLIYTLRGRRAC